MPAEQPPAHATVTATYAPDGEDAAGLFEPAGITRFRGGMLPVREAVTAA